MTLSNFQEKPVTLDPKLECDILRKVYPDLPMLSSKGANWQGIRAGHCVQPAHETPEFFFGEHIIHISAAQPNIVEFQTKHGQFQEVLLHGHIGIYPAHQAQKMRWQGDIESIHLYLDPVFMQQAIAESTKGQPIEVMPRLKTNDPLIRSLGIALISELRFNKEGSRLYAETVAALLSIHLLQHYTVWKQAVKHYAEGLSQGKLHQTLDYIHSYLDQNLSLNELAALVYISPYHFARLFKQSTGMAPHQYVTKCRIKKAKRLLAQQELSILEITHQVGFQSQSYFTTLFRRSLGVTPTSYRNSL
jgi:AraC family transcriptional regulator